MLKVRSLVDLTSPLKHRSKKKTPAPSCRIWTSPLCSTPCLAFSCPLPQQFTLLPSPRRT
jgi:hypothetical protein